MASSKDFVKIFSDVHRLRRMARLRRDLPASQGQGRVGSRAVSDLRYAAGQGDGLPFEAAHDLHRPELRHEPGARRCGWSVPRLRREGKELPAHRPA